MIGDFSKITRLSIKTLRYYHEINLLCPDDVDETSGYRFYNEKNIEKAYIILELKNFDFSLKEIKNIIDNYDDDIQINEIMKKKSDEIKNKIEKYKNIESKLNSFLINNKKVGKNMIITENIKEKNLEDILIASIRFKGSYQDVGEKIGKLYKTCGRYVTGNPFSLYYDDDFKDGDADIEICLNVKKEFNKGDIKSRILKGGKAISIIHKGSYDMLGNSYKTIIDYKNEKNLNFQIPSREIYIKGPGMVFKGNPENYITEIQFVVDN
jgi:DNA-binding transcriptional MerR regulator